MYYYLFTYCYSVQERSLHFGKVRISLSVFFHTRHTMTNCYMSVSASATLFAASAVAVHPPASIMHRRVLQV